MKSEIQAAEKKRVIDIKSNGEVVFCDKAFEKQICDATGQVDPLRALYLVSITKEGINSFQGDDQITYVLKAFEKMQPADEIEGFLIQQFLLLHHQGVDRLNRAKKSSSTDSSDIQVKMATKLLRLSQDTLQTLLKHRNKGQQQVFVTHVSDGGKAIIGNLNQPKEGGDGKK